MDSKSEKINAGGGDGGGNDDGKSRKRSYYIISPQCEEIWNRNVFSNPHRTPVAAAAAVPVKRIRTTYY